MGDASRWHTRVGGWVGGGELAGGWREPGAGVSKLAFKEELPDFWDGGLFGKGVVGRLGGGGNLAGWKGAKGPELGVTPITEEGAGGSYQEPKGNRDHYGGRSILVSFRSSP